MFRFEPAYARLPEILHSRQDPAPVVAPRLVIYNTALAEAMGLAPTPAETIAALLSGNRLPEGAVPLAQAYAGHQFGHLNMLGDGRAVLLGEHRMPDGTLVDVQLKGAGRTLFSRSGDGRAALGPMLREYIISEAMHGLGIPTSRSLAVVLTGETVQRDRPLPGAILTRVAASHLRVGTFEYAARLGDPAVLKQLADFAMAQHDPALQGDYPAFLRAVMERQARLVAQWMLAGFVHGVMNTDNMAISGETIDYGPCAFLDRYDPDTVFSSIDAQGRYAYANQPRIAQWNLARFAESLLPLLAGTQAAAIALAEAALQDFPARYAHHWLEGMRAKLGLFSAEPGDADLAQALLDAMRQAGADYTRTFRDLSTALAGQFPPAFPEWQAQWAARLARQPENPAAAIDRMERHNPAITPRNQEVETVLAAAEAGDLAPMQALLAALATPYRPPADPRYAQPPAPGQAPYRTFCGT